LATPALCDAFHGQAREALLHQEIIGRFEHGLACRFTPSMPVPVMHAGLLAISCLDKTLRLA
jgi:hypothetical protein